MIVHANKTVLQRTNKKLITKQIQKHQKTFKKKYEQTKMLIVNVKLAIRKKKQTKQETLMKKKKRYHVLNDKMKFVKTV